MQFNLFNNKTKNKADCNVNVINLEDPFSNIINNIQEGKKSYEVVKSQ